MSKSRVAEEQTIAPQCDFAELVPATYAPYCRQLRLGTPEAGVAVPLPGLVEHLDVLLAVMRQQYGGGDAQALLSQWSGYYFSLLLPPALVAARVLRRPLAMALDNCTLLLRDGMPQTLWLPADALGVATDDAAQRYRSLCVDHLAPLIEMLSAAVRLAPRVLWNHVGNSLEYALSTGFAGELAQSDADYLFGRREFFDTGRANPLRQPVRYVNSPAPLLASPFRARRVCCLRDRLPGESMLCSSCPKLLTLKEHELAEQLRLRKACFSQ